MSRSVWLLHIDFAHYVRTQEVCHVRLKGAPAHIWTLAAHRPHYWTDPRYTSRWRGLYANPIQY